MMWYKCDVDTITLTVYVQPGAKRTEISGLHDGALKIRLASPPIEGRANAALVQYIAKLFDVPLKQVELKQGGKSRRKVIMISHSQITPDSILEFPSK